MPLTGIVGGRILALARVVCGLPGVGMGLVALARWPFLLLPATGGPRITVDDTVFALAMTIQLRPDIV